MPDTRYGAGDADRSAYRDHPLRRSLGPTPSPADAVPPKGLRSILLWPLRIDDSSDDLPTPEAVDRFIGGLTRGGAWTDRTTFGSDGTAPVDYGAYVYFQPFVHRWLYRRDRLPGGERRLRRAEVTSASFDLAAGRHRVRRISAGVVRCDLHAFANLRLALVALELTVDPATAMVEMTEAEARRDTDVGVPRPMTMADTLDFLAAVRRAYPPWYETTFDQQPGPLREDVNPEEKSQRGHLRPRSGGFFLKARFFDDKGLELGYERQQAQRPDARRADHGDDADDDVDRLWTGIRTDTGQPPFAAHWRQLLWPLMPGANPGGTRPRSRKQLGVFHIVDDRIPHMTWLAVTEPWKLTRAQMVRLCFSDTAGNRPEDLPYAGDFLADFERKHAYDRFWAPNNRRSPHTGMHTRYLVSDSTFIVLGDDDDDFFTSHDALQGHFRHHYFTLGLMAHLHRAFLLMIEHFLAVAARDFEPQRWRRFRDRMQEIEPLFLEFTNRYWFDNPTAQMQGDDLFRKWSGMLGTPTLFSKIREELRDASAYLDNRFNAQLNRRLLWIGLLALGYGLLGIELFQESTTKQATEGWLSPWLRAVSSTISNGWRWLFGHALDFHATNILLVVGITALVPLCFQLRSIYRFVGQAPGRVWRRLSGGAGR